MNKFQEVSTLKMELEKYFLLDKHIVEGLSKSTILKDLEKLECYPLFNRYLMGVCSERIGEIKKYDSFSDFLFSCVQNIYESMQKLLTTDLEMLMKVSDHIELCQKLEIDRLYEKRTDR